MADLRFLGFGVDISCALRGLNGLVKIKPSIEKLLRPWDKGARDKFENHKLLPVPFTPHEVVSFAYAQLPFAPGPTVYNA